MIIVLIDDDSYIRLSWKLHFSLLKIDFHAFESVAYFLDFAIDRTRPVGIYIDSSLKDGKKGEVEAKQLYEMGFKNLVLTTGYAANLFSIEEYPWIMNVRGKSPPAREELQKLFISQ